MNHHTTKPNTSEPTGYTYYQWLQELKPTVREKFIKNISLGIIFALPLTAIFTCAYSLLSENAPRDFIDTAFVSFIVVFVFVPIALTALVKVDAAQEERTTKLCDAYPEHVEFFEAVLRARLREECPRV